MALKDRHEEILSILKVHGHVSIHKLSQMIHISEPTLRRDLAALDSMGLIKRTHGGAMIPENDAYQPLVIRNADDVTAKKIICAKAASLIKNNSTIFIDSSSTAYFLTRYLTDKQNLTVVTNSVLLSQHLCEMKINTYCTGGYIDVNDMALRGSYAEEFLKKMRFDMAFFSCSGLSHDGWLSGHMEHGVSFLKTLLEQSACRVLLRISRKIGVSCPHQLCTLADIDEFVTDQPLSEVFRKMIGSAREKGRSTLNNEK